MPRQRVPVTQEQWNEAVDQYEIGYTTARVLAERLGVSAATFSREMKRRGARKGSRAMEAPNVVALKAHLDRKARLRAQGLRQAEAAAWQRSALIEEMLGRMVRSLVEATTDDEWARAADEVEKIAEAMGAKRR